jgi:hypothetical protein
VVVEQARETRREIEAQQRGAGAEIEKGDEAKGGKER